MNIDVIQSSSEVEVWVNVDYLCRINGLCNHYDAPERTELIDEVNQHGTDQTVERKVKECACGAWYDYDYGHWENE